MMLRKFAEEGNVEELRRLLKGSSKPKELLNTKFGPFKMTALHIAIEKGHEEVVRLLFEYDADPRATDHYGRTALHVATSIPKENSNILESILNCKDVDVNAQEENQNTPVKLAAEKGHLKTVESLISRGADVDKADKVDNTALHFAAKKGHDQVLELLLTKVAERTVGKQNKDKKTALHFAVESKSERCVALLLAHGAGTCIESKNEQGRTPLDLANDDPNQNIIALLKDPKKARAFLEGPKSNTSKAPLGKGGSVESDSIGPHEAAPQMILGNVLPGVIPPRSLDGATSAFQVVQISGNLSIHHKTNVTVKDNAMASIGSGSRVNIAQPNNESSASHQQHFGGSEFNVEVSDEAHAVIGDHGVMNVNPDQSRTPSNAGTRDRPFNFPGDQENRDPYGRSPPETGTPMENSDSQRPCEVSLPPSEEPPGHAVRGTLFRSFQGEPPSGEGDKSLFQPIQEEFPSEKGSEGLTHPVQEDSPPGKDEHYAVQEEQSQAKQMQEESPGDKDSGTLRHPVQEDSPPRKVHQTLHQPVQEEATRDEDGGVSPFPVQEESPRGKDHQLLAQPVQEEAPRDKDDGALPVQVQGDSSSVEGDKSLIRPVQEVFHRDGSLPYPIKEEHSSNTTDLPKTGKERAASANQSVKSVPSNPAMFKRNPATGQTWQTDARTNPSRKAPPLTSSTGKSQSISENVEAQSREGMFPDGNHQSADRGQLHRVPLSGGQSLFHTTPRNRVGWVTSSTNSSENPQAESSISEAPHRTERHPRDNSVVESSLTATIDMGNVDSSSESVQDENPVDDQGGRKVCDCRLM